MWKALAECKLHQCARTIIVSALTASAVTGSLMGVALAGAQVQGQIGSMQLQATNATLQEVLDALPREFRVTYQLPPDIQRDVSGRYSGTLNQVLARILDGYNYIVEVTEEGTRIVVLGGSPASSRPPSDAAVILKGPAVAPGSPASIRPPSDAAVILKGPAVAPHVVPSMSIPPLTSYR